MSNTHFFRYCFQIQAERTVFKFTFAEIIFSLLMCVFYQNLRRTVSDKYGKHSKQHSSKEDDKEDLKNKANLLFPYIHKHSTRSASVHMEQKKIQIPKSESSDVKDLRLKLQKVQQAYQQQALQINQVFAEIKQWEQKLQTAVAMDIQNLYIIDVYRQRISAKQKLFEIFIKEQHYLRGEIRYLTQRLYNPKN